MEILNEPELVVADLFADKYHLFLGRKPMPELPGAVEHHLIGERVLRCAGYSGSFYLVATNTESEAIAGLNAQGLATGRVRLDDDDGAPKVNLFFYPHEPLLGLVPVSDDLIADNLDNLTDSRQLERELVDGWVEIWLEDQGKASGHAAIVDDTRNGRPDFVLTSIGVVLLVLARDAKTARRTERGN